MTGVQTCALPISNNFISSIPTFNSTLNFDAFNVTTTDFVPTTTSINYSYNATLVNGSAAGEVSINPGKLGSSSYENIWLDDGKGERILDSNNSTSFSVYASLSSNDDAVSPLVSDAGLSVHALQFGINNCELSNNIIAIANTGAGYNANTTLVTISAPTGLNGTQAYAYANVSNGAIQSIVLTLTRLYYKKSQHILDYMDQILYQQ